MLNRGGLEVALCFLALAYNMFLLRASRPEMGWTCRLRHPDLKRARIFRVGQPFEKYLIFHRAHGTGIDVLRALHGTRILKSRSWTEGV